MIVDWSWFGLGLVRRSLGPVDYTGVWGDKGLVFRSWVVKLRLL